jgi:hypothetical protein
MYPDERRKVLIRLDEDFTLPEKAYVSFNDAVGVEWKFYLPSGGLEKRRRRPFWLRRLIGPDKDELEWDKFINLDTA